MRIELLAQIVLLASSVVTLDIRTQVNDNVESLHCPGGTLVNGLSLSVSNTLTWADKISSSKSTIPFSVCIYCRAIRSKTNSDTENKVYQVCISQGDLSQAVPQIFECTQKDFLQNFYKNESQTTSYFSCHSFREEDAASNSQNNIQPQLPSIYEAKFPSALKGGGRMSVAKQNWNDLEAELECGGTNDIPIARRQFLCGIELEMNHHPSELERVSSNQTDELLARSKRLSLPRLAEICCYGTDVMGLPRVEFFSSECSTDYDAHRKALIVIATLFCVSLLLLFFCAIHICCCKVFDCSKSDPSVNPTKYENHENGGDKMNGSQLNTRPNSASLQSAIIVPVKTTYEEETEEQS